MNFAVYATGHGYGHLARILEVMREIVRLHPSSEIHVRAPFSKERVQNFLGYPPTSRTQVRLDVGLVQYDSLRHDHEESMQRLQFFFGKDGDLLLKREAEWLRSRKIDVALIDIPPHAFEAAHKADIPSVGIGNFGWDRVWDKLSAERPEYKRFADIASRYYSRAEVFYSGGMEFGLEAFKEIERVPLIARGSALSKEEAKRQLGLNSDRPVVLIAFGGEGLKGFEVPADSLLQSCQFVATPPLHDLHPAIRFISEKEINARGLRYNDLVRAADAAILKPGYSTVAECAANGTAIVVVPRVSFPEADVIQRFVEQNLPSETLSIEQLLAGEWDSALRSLLAKRPFDFRDIRTNGAEIIARRILQRFAG